MVYYCSSCRILYDEPIARCKHCGEIISFDAVRSRKVYLAEGYHPDEEAGKASKVMLAQDLAETDTVANDEPSGSHHQRVSPPRRGSPEPGYNDFPMDRDNRRTIPTPSPNGAGGASGTGRSPDEIPEAPPTPPPGFTDTHRPFDPGYDTPNGSNQMQPPPIPNYGRRSEVVDDSGCNGGGGASSSWRRTILVIALLLMVGLLLYLLWGAREAISNVLSKIVLIVIVIAAAIVFFKRR